MSQLYQLVESVDGGAFRQCPPRGRHATASDANTLANWLAARAYYWHRQGYTVLDCSIPNEVTALDAWRRMVVVVKVEAV